MTSDRECFVYIVPPGATTFVTAGRFRLITTREGVAVGQFVYGRSYLAREDAVALDPVELRLRRGLHETTRMGGFFGAIRDAMPDFWGRRVIERNVTVAQLDELDYLLHGPDDRAGALGFGLGPEPPPPRRTFNQTLDLERLQSVADVILRDDRAAPTGFDNAQTEPLAGQPEDRAERLVEELLLLGTSMGGARPKAVVEDAQNLWIAKFCRADDGWDHPAVEHAMLELARECGLQVAHSRLTRVADRNVLLVRRFDRDMQEHERAYRRHRMVSGLTLLRGDDDPTRRTEWSYLLLADEIRRVSASPAADLRELFARMCFNAAISNTDDHPRNHAVLAKSTDWRLSPAFDLTPTPSFSLDRRELALVCGDQGRYANRANLLTACGRFLLNPEEAATLLDDMAETIRSQWHPTLRRAGVTEPDCERLASAFLYPGFHYGVSGAADYLAGWSGGRGR